MIFRCEPCRVLQRRTPELALPGLWAGDAPWLAQVLSKRTVQFRRRRSSRGWHAHRWRNGRQARNGRY